MKVALIHDWLTGMRGGEKCLEIFCSLYPDADIFTLIHNKGTVSECIEQMKINTSFVQKLPFLNKYRRYLPLFPSAIEQFDLNEYDLVLSSSHCVAKGVITGPETLHICYCHTPMRYVWDMYNSYFGKGNAGLLSRCAIPFFANYLRSWDVSSSMRVEYFIANSHYVAKRIKKFYNRNAKVIHPPVDCSVFKIQKNTEDFYLVVSAFAPYKRVDLAIKAFNKLELPLVVIGSGQDEKKLKQIAKKNITFLGWQADNVIRDYYAKCKALIFPGKEDFGIVPLEVQACGRPVIAYGVGGVCETVIPINSRIKNDTTLQENTTGYGLNEQQYATGIFFYEQTVDAVINSVREYEEVKDRFDSAIIRTHALTFDKPIFKTRIKNHIDHCVNEHNERIF